MESRFLLLLLAQAAVLVGLTGCGRDKLVAEDNGQPPVIEPDVERREIETAKIDTEDFEVGIYAGEISVEDFGVNSMVGARIRLSHHRGLLPRRHGGRGIRSSRASSG